MGLELWLSPFASEAAGAESRDTLYPGQAAFLEFQKHLNLSASPTPASTGGWGLMSVKVSFFSVLWGSVQVQHPPGNFLGIHLSILHGSVLPVALPYGVFPRF